MLCVSRMRRGEGPAMLYGNSIDDAYFAVLMRHPAARCLSAIGVQDFDGTR